MREIMIYMAITGIMNILCFFIGGKVAQMIYKGKEIKIIPNPVEAIKEMKNSKEIDKEEEKMKIIAENIDNYDGTSNHQKEIGG